MHEAAPNLASFAAKGGGRTPNMEMERKVCEMDGIHSWNYEWNRRHQPGETLKGCIIEYSIIVPW